MATLDDIIRDAINGTRPKGKGKKYLTKEYRDMVKNSQGPLRRPLFGALPQPRKQRATDEEMIEPRNIPYNQRPKFVQKPKRGSAAAYKGGGPRRTLRERTSQTGKAQYK